MAWELADWARELRCAARRLGREPWVTRIILLVLTLGVGYNLVLLQLMEQLWFRPPEHLREPAELRQVSIARYSQEAELVRSARLSYPVHRLLAADSGAFAGVASYLNTTLGSRHGERELSVSLVTPEYFSVLGTAPARGRFFGPQYGDRPDEPLAVLSYGAWRQLFGSSASAIGQSVFLGDVPYQIVGIAPEGFAGPDRERMDVWVPLAAAAATVLDADWRDNWESAFLRTVVRLKPGVTAEAAAARAAARYAAARPAAAAPAAARLATVTLDKLSARTGPGHFRLLQVSALLGMVSLLLYLSACANVANLLLARSISHRHEVAVRLALGATRGALARLVLAEALLLAGLGSLVGAGAAVVGSRAMHTWLLPDLVWSLRFTRPWVLASLGILALVTVLGAGGVPAVLSERVALDAALRSRAPGGTARWARWQSVVVVVEVALMVTLLAGTGAFVRAFQQVRAMEVGFDTQQVLVVEFEDRTRPPRQLEWLYRSALEAVRALPGVTNAALATAIPLRYSTATYLRASKVDTVPRLPTGGPYVAAVDAAYFATVGGEVVAGRVFTARDDATGPPVAVVNQSMAQRVWGRRNVVGECLWVADDQVCRRVVGVVKDQKREMLMEGPTLQFFLPLAQAPPFLELRALFVRTAGPATRLVTPMRRTLARLDPSAPYARIQVLGQLLQPELRAWKLAAVVFTVYGCVAVLVGTFGIYGVAASCLAQRKRELAVRLALGSGVWDAAVALLRPLLRDGLVGLGLGVGLVGLGWTAVAQWLVGTSLLQALAFGSGALAVLGAVAAYSAGQGLASGRRQLAATLAEE